MLNIISYFFIFYRIFFKYLSIIYLGDEMENIDIRNYIIENFKDDNAEKIRDSIETTIKERDEDALIGLGVLFELLWNSLSKEEKDKNLEYIRNSIKNLANN